VRTVAGELAVNAIVHAATLLTVTLSRSGHTVRLSAHDASSGTPTRRSAQVMAEGGYGLNLTSALSSDWGVTADADDTKSVWATFDIHLVGDRGWA
jgi:2-oxoglutarate dehydrogenase complex dehydrogenase (E1) component-like enzyme